MENHRKEEALQNKKRRKEQLNLKRGKKKSMHFRGNGQDEI